MSEAWWWLAMGKRPTMLHRFAGDPWGVCSACGQPAYHPIHETDAKRGRAAAAEHEQGHQR